MPMMLPVLQLAKRVLNRATGCAQQLWTNWCITGTHMSREHLPQILQMAFTHLVIELFLYIYFFIVHRMLPILYEPDDNIYFVHVFLVGWTHLCIEKTIKTWQILTFMCSWSNNIACEAALCTFWTNIKVYINLFEARCVSAY